MFHQRSRFAFELILSALCAVVLAGSPAYAQSSAPGGFVDSATSAGLRPAVSSGQSQTFLPARGAFTFPAPYNTTAFRLTNNSDCGGADCVSPVGYSYWSNINNHVGSDTMLVFLGLDRRKGGGGSDAVQLQQAHRRDEQHGGRFSRRTARTPGAREKAGISAAHARIRFT